MREKTVWTPLFILLLLGASAIVSAAVFNERDSTQPRGAPTNRYNKQKQSLDPVIEGFRSPAYRANEQEDDYKDWVSSMMANASRDPAFFAALSIANQDMIRFINSLPGEPNDPSSELGAFLKQNKMEKDIYRAPDKNLQPETLLPITADFCLRCHVPVGWLEGRSEPSSKNAPFLKGQHWGAAFLETPIDQNVKPRKADLTKESESEMEGIRCDFCHRVVDNFKRNSRYDGSLMANGNGGFIVDPQNPFCEDYDQEGTCTEEFVEPKYDFQGESSFCGTCHDVSNPLLKTRTIVNGKVPDMPHPVERTYTEWYWSDYRNEKQCQDCHRPMRFKGAQTWMTYPVLGMLWGDVDQVWRGEPYNYTVPDRSRSYKNARKRNHVFMRTKAAKVELVETPAKVKRNDLLTVKVKITNKAGHKLPTGFIEGRQMWIHIKAVDELEKVIFEDGFMKEGYLVRTPETKVYEQVAFAEGYPFLDKNGDGKVDEKEGHFHVVLMNSIKKDNRIPPKGYNRAAYNADGAFIIPYDPKDTDYADRQNWDVTPYTFRIPEGAKGRVRVSATLKYQTFSREYVEFLKKYDTEKTRECGGRARNLPSTGPYGGDCKNYDTWGKAFYDLWKKAEMGPPVEMETATVDVDLEE